MSTAARLVVGDDGSDLASAAVRWAAASAVETGATLRLVNVADVPVMAGLGWRVDAAFEAGRLLKAAKEVGRHLEERRCRELRAAHPGLQVDYAVVSGDPREVLVRESRDAELMVVGSRGRGPVTALLLGSVSAFVARHAACPTVVFREGPPGGHGVLAWAQLGDEPRVLELATSFAAAHDEPLTVLSDLDDADRVVDASRTSRLVVLGRRPRTRLLHDRAIVVAEHCGCPVVVVPAPDA